MKVSPSHLFSIESCARPPSCGGGGRISNFTRSDGDGGGRAVAV